MKSYLFSGIKKRKCSISLARKFSLESHRILLVVSFPVKPQYMKLKDTERPMVAIIERKLTKVTVTLYPGCGSMEKASGGMILLVLLLTVLRRGECL